MNKNDQYDEEYQKYLQKIGMAPTIQVINYQGFNNQSVKEMSLNIKMYQEKEPIFQTINSITILSNQCKSDFRAKNYSALLKNYKEDEKPNQSKQQLYLSSSKNTTSDSHSSLIMNEDAISNNSQLSKTQQINLKLDLCSSLDFASHNALQLPKFNLDGIEAFEKHQLSSPLIQEGINSINHFENNIELCVENESISRMNIVSALENMNLNQQVATLMENQQIEDLQSCKNNVIVEQNQQQVNPDKETGQIFPQNQNDGVIEKKQQEPKTINIKTNKQKEKQKKSRKINKKKRRQQRRNQLKNNQIMNKFLPYDIVNLDQKEIQEYEFTCVQEINKEQKIENPVCKFLKKIILGFLRKTIKYKQQSHNLLYKQIMIKRQIFQKNLKIHKKKY